MCEFRRGIPVADGEVFAEAVGGDACAKEASEGVFVAGFTERWTRGVE